MADQDKPTQDEIKMKAKEQLKKTGGKLIVLDDEQIVHASPGRPELPPHLGFFGSRPQASSASQREKRRQDRKGPIGKVTSAVTNGVGELLLFGTIGEDWFGEGITAITVDSALKEMGAVSNVKLRVNSGGGDVFEATAIYNALIKHPASISVEIEGVAASAATLISMAGDSIHISENAHFMIHAASGLAWGNAAELEQYLKLLNNADTLIRLTYGARTGIEDSELAEMMSFDNWMTAQEAFDHGFVDAIDEAKKVSPHVSPEDSVTRKPAALSPERLAAASGYLTALSANVQPITGQQPATVTPSAKDEKMNKKLRAMCVKAGMAENLDDKAANEWFDANADLVFSQVHNTGSGDGDGGSGSGSGGKQLELVAAELRSTPSLTAEQVADIIDKRETEAKARAKAWKADIESLLNLSLGEDYPVDLRDRLVDLDDMTEVHDAIRDHKAKASERLAESIGPRITFADQQPRDAHLNAIRTGLMARCINGFSTVEDGKLKPEERLAKYLPEDKRAKGWEDFAQMPLIKIAEESLYADGFSHQDVRRMNSSQVAMAALGFHSQAGVRADAAVHTTGSLAEITKDAINKSLTAGYEEAPQTWRGPGRQAASVPDFKEKHVIKLGAAANLPVWADNSAPEKAKLSNERESYAVEARAETLTFSWRLIVNDDLDALSRGPQLLGDASARTVNAVFWAQVTSNPTLADNIALFSVASGARMRPNLITGAATPTNTTIATMKSQMRLMHGLNTPEGVEGDDVLNLTPTYIVGPTALEELILKQVFSGADPASGGNSAVFNTAATLQPIIEPLLDANSATAWYLFASPSRIDTIEVTFLQGQETPFVHMWMDDSTMSQNATIVQTFNAKAIDHRGIQKHAGA